MSVPYGLLSLLGVRPAIVQDARAVNLLYQFWIHTEAVRSLGPLEKVFNSPSAHRVHHGSNRRYLDRNHGSILIISHQERILETADKIVVLAAGEIKAVGSKEEIMPALMDASSVCSRLVDKV